MNLHDLPERQRLKGQQTFFRTITTTPVATYTLDVRATADWARTDREWRPLRIGLAPPRETP